MPKKQPKGEYHYAIAVLSNERDMLQAKPDRYRKPKKCLRSVEAALDLLTLNNLPPTPKKKSKDGREKVYGAIRSDMSAAEADEAYELERSHDTCTTRAIVA